VSHRKSTHELVKDIQQAGGCSHPIRLRGEFVNVATGEVNERPLLVACKDRRALLCPSCSYLYKADAWIVVSTGLIGGKGVPASISEHPRLFLTLTAPSFGTVHRRRNDGSCQPGPLRFCAHHRALACSRCHEESDPEIGSPLCDFCYHWADAVLWNAESSRLWNRTFEQIRRRLSIALGVSLEQLSQHVRLNYLKVAEFQRRGLAHFHVVLRVDGPRDPFSPPPPIVTTELLTGIIATVVSDFSIVSFRGKVSWGRNYISLTPRHSTVATCVSRPTWPSTPRSRPTARWNSLDDSTPAARSSRSTLLGTFNSSPSPPGTSRKILRSCP
jgi:hypothetical protein